MRSVSVRRLVGALGATLALATALLIPVGYGLIEYWKDSEALAYKADLSAARAATFILGGQADWRGDTERLRAAIDVGGRNAAPVRQSVTDARGATVLETGDAPPAPTYSRIAPITVHGIIAGWSRIVDSLRPLLIKVAIVAGVSLTLAVAAYYMFATLPLKLLDRSLSELERANARFRQQNLLLDTALGNMFQGLAMFDAGERLVIANGRFAEMYGLPPEDIRPGTPLRRILAHRVASAAEGNATVEDQLQALRKQLACSNSSHLAERLSDGRAILVSIRPMPEGGWVSTHQDVTERENLNAELAHQNELLRQREDELEERNKQFDAALRNMSQGLAMFDAEQRLVICNELYARIYGLTPDQVEPGTPLHRIVRQQIANGCQSEGDADALQGWLARRAAGEGPSQMTCELEDGRAVSVSAQTMPNGGIVTTHRDITEQRYAEARIVHMALHDSLTELPNRTLLDERLQQALTRVRRGEMVAVHTLDLDHFKTVNDTLGHPIGDKLLKQVTERLLALVRETDTVARMGGDEFAIVQVAIGQPTDATTLAHRIIEVVSKPYDIEGQQIDIGASIGIAMAPADGDNPADLLRNSDLALYRAKGDGRGTFCFFEPCMDEQMQARRVLESDLRRAIPAREFELHYQPVIDLDSNEISSFEALVRWRHPLKGLVPPDVFLPLAEKLGITIALGEWAIRDACTTARGWSRELNVAVNLSPRQFRNPGLVQIVADALDDSGLPAHRLELDITEPVLMGESESALSVLHGLRDLGVKLAMDDFGTGYASLSYLHSFAFDKIKIDRSFVKSVAADSGSLNVVRAVAAMAHSLGMSTTAEGVETFEQLEIVRTEGCNEIQGFLFSPPLPASDIDRILKRGIRFAMPAGAENAA
jgi:diguanylate cyclase (GGDEF)-like protein